MTELIVAIDYASAFDAALLVERTIAHTSIYKVGSELMLAIGTIGVKLLDLPGLMLDLKFHDIPETVERAVRASLPLAPRFFTIHASGGQAMIEAARRAAEEAVVARPQVLAVTALTSLAPVDLAEVGFAARSRGEAVLTLAKVAVNSGADGLVCSVAEAAMLRAEFGSSVVLVTPGVRPVGSGRDDHARTASIAEAVQAGSDYVVVGRPISQAQSPGEAARAIVNELASYGAGGVVGVGSATGVGAGSGAGAGVGVGAGVAGGGATAAASAVVAASRAAP